MCWPLIGSDLWLFTIRRVIGEALSTVLSVLLLNIEGG